MNTRETPDIRSAAERLLADLDAVLDGPDAHEGPLRIARLSRPCAAVDPVAWMHAQTESIKWYWCGRDNGGTLAGAGAAWHTKEAMGHALGPAVGQVDELLAASDPDVRALGGMRFDGGRTAAPSWEPFGALQVVVPRVEVREENGRFTLACHVLLPDDARDPAAQDAIRSAIEGAGAAVEPLPAFDVDVVERRDRPDPSKWVVAVTACLDAFAREEAEKVVLARQTDFRAAKPVDGLVLLDALEEATPHSYHFYFQPEDGLAFVGASPERLYQRNGQHLATEALAGTRPRGTSSEEDDQLGRDLMANDKERREHDYVSRSIRMILSDFCDDLTQEEVGLMQLGHCQHLLTRFQGTLRKHVGDAELLARLHPTPAVGGVPRDIAIRRIRELEAFDRGWYTGPVGWIGREQAEFAVAIRSALVHNAVVSVYTGAGIVPGSDPDEEWQELENKLADFRALFEGATAISGPAHP